MNAVTTIINLSTIIACLNLSVPRAQPESTIPGALFRRVEIPGFTDSGATIMENNKLVNITDTTRDHNEDTGRPQGLGQPLKFQCGVSGELTVDGRKTSKTR
jgi:hypothetical protein